MKKTFAILAVLPLVACSSKRTASTPATAAPKNIGDYQFVPTTGDCHEPRWSPNGDRVLYLCALRTGHDADQLYVYDRIRGTEQRVTWQVGAISGHDWVDNDRIVYSSTTDEMKERLFRVNSVEAGTGSDVYLSDLMGENILRLTDEPGEDRVLRWDAGVSKILVLSVRAGQPRARWIALNGRSSPADLPSEACQPRLLIGEAPLRQIDIRGRLVAGVTGDALARKIFWKEAPLEQLSCAPERPSVK